MASTDDALVAEALTAADAAAVSPLSAEAGWNQTVDDWRFMLREGRGVGVREMSGRWVGSALALPLGAALSWISMVLVAKDARRRGIGTRLLQHAIEHAQTAGGVAGLDATELGRPVYPPLGFRDLYAISRLRLAARVDMNAPDSGFRIRPLVAADLAAVTTFDAPRSAMTRAPILAYLLEQAPSAAFVAEKDGRIVGYALGRPGRTAFQLGPVVANDESIAIVLVTTALSRLSGPVMIDVPDAHANLRVWLDRHGAVRERGFTRMVRGDMPPGLADPRAVFALAGPELG